VFLVFLPFSSQTVVVCFRRVAMVVFLRRWLLLFFVLPCCSQPPAQVAYGDSGLFNVVAANAGNNLLSTPTGVVVVAGNVTVADTGNSRLMMFPMNASVASAVLGQPDFASQSVNNGGLGVGFNNPTDVVAALSGSALFVSDTMNHRVLRLVAGVFDFVWGQMGNFSANTQNLGRNFSKCLECAWWTRTRPR
jgi:hypothetical protein